MPSLSISDLFSGAEFEKCSPICQQRTVKHENREKFKAFVNAAEAVIRV